MEFIAESIKRLDITDEVYFSDQYSEYLSNSRLSLLNPAQNGSIYKFNTPFAKGNEAFKLGSAIHALILEPEKYTLSDFTAPSGVIATIFETTYKLTHRAKNPVSFDEALEMAVKLHGYYGESLNEKRRNSILEKGMNYYEYLKQDFSEGLLILNQEDKAVVEHAVRSVNNNKEALEKLRPSLINGEVNSEIAFTIDIEHEGEIFKFKMKADNFILDYDRKVLTLNDLKTTGYDVSEFMGNSVLELRFDGQYELKNTFKEGSFQKYHYYRQMYLYSEVMKNYLTSLSLRGWTIESNIVVVDKNKFRDTDNVAVYRIDDSWMNLGKQETEYLLDLLVRKEEGEYDL